MAFDPRDSGPFVEHLGLEITEASGERVTATWTAGEKHHQPYGIVHGGVHASVVETLDERYVPEEFIGTEAEQTKQVGNSVPVSTAQALVLSQIQNIPGVLPIDLARRRRDPVGAPVHQYRAAA